MMAVVEALICNEEDGSISFGNYKLEQKEKIENFSHLGDLYKLKTNKSITKLEKNGTLIYESVPGTSVSHFEETEKGISFLVSGKGNTQITVELETEVEYKVQMDHKDIGAMNTNLGGKLSVSLELSELDNVAIKIMK